MVYTLFFGNGMFKELDGKILFSPEPNLPGSWFRKTDEAFGNKNTVSLKLFGVPVNFVNPSRKNTFGTGAVKPVEFEWVLDGRFYHHKGRHLTPEASLALREGRLEHLTVRLG